MVSALDSGSSGLGSSVALFSDGPTPSTQGKEGVGEGPSENQARFERWPGSLCCVLGKDTLIYYAVYIFHMVLPMYSLWDSLCLSSLSLSRQRHDVSNSLPVGLLANI